MKRTPHDAGVDGAQVFGGLAGVHGALSAIQNTRPPPKELIKTMLKGGMKLGAIGALIGYPVAAITKALSE